MSGMGTVLQRDLKDLRRTNAFRIVAIVFTVLTIGAAVGASIGLNRWEWLGQAPPEITNPMLEFIMGLTVYFLTFFALISFIWAFTSDPITKEKANGNIESLLATPLSPKAIWMGKSLAIFLPGFAIGVVSSLIVLLAVNFAVIRPTIGNFVLPAPVLFTGLVGNPLLFFGLTSLIILIALAYNPDTGVMLSMLLGWGLLIVMGAVILLGKINMASWWPFTLCYLASAIVLEAVVLYLSRLLTKEKIVLSSKGG